MGHFQGVTTSWTTDGMWLLTHLFATFTGQTRSRPDLIKSERRQHNQYVHCLCKHQNQQNFRCTQSNKEPPFCCVQSNQQTTGNITKVTLTIPVFKQL